jgi:transcriptional regulator with XRE-family HTH domain
MKINAQLVTNLRKQRSWTQEELAIASGLDLRTVQRVEKQATASLQSMKALASALDIDARDLEHEELHMKPCPVGGSNEIYQHKEYFRDSGGTGETLLPGLGSNLLMVAKVRTCVCEACGLVRIFASEDARRQLKTSTRWERVGD